GLGPGWSTVANTPFRRHKSWNHEGGIATPLVVCWPAGIQARGELRHSPGHLIDIVPTLLQLANVTAPANWNGERRPPLPGISLVPAFASDVHVERELFFKHTINRALRVGDWKITASGDDAPWELYDLATDRVEERDLASQDPKLVAKLAERWSQRNAEYAAEGATAGDLPKKANKRAAKKAGAAAE
ncbi:MAG TPA: sulfatase/phosphatase domain-containing protein, partial [Pirellulales bacterium]|nr:sulfatase/phosphatase domain-containing protein [Pirellulales bacterium]